MQERESCLSVKGRAVPRIGYRGRTARQEERGLRRRREPSSSAVIDSVGSKRRMIVKGEGNEPASSSQ
jgi:hypothetical protein